MGPPGLRLLGVKNAWEPSFDFGQTDKGMTVPGAPQDGAAARQSPVADGPGASVERDFERKGRGAVNQGVVRGDRDFQPRGSGPGGPKNEEMRAAAIATR